LEKYFRAGQAADDNMAHAHCLLDNQGYKHTLRVTNNHWFSTATVLARKYINDTLYLHFLSCSYF